MDIATSFFIALGLAMDAFSVSISSGLRIQRKILFYAFFIALAFGVFQALMPALGFAGARSFSDLIADFGNWVAFALLVFVGAKMIYEALKHKDNEQTAPPGFFLILLLAVATSIDAFAVGIGFACLAVDILREIAIIGSVTFVLSFVGVLISTKIRKILSPAKSEFAGGVILIAIAIKILLKL